ncbi:hypothetical protein HF313_21890 [Massilia atriviolacea]|uniref:Lipoprotein n=1 Tax=Massilia atriviolacea TaxID=2495579 RepID=A0A430HF86_9BURK|nr:hypothetical protein [Massilia atriviolacea]RSZ56224.1 hypothetical protein EJB06_25325 [Massilia atriviolacea]
MLTLSGCAGVPASATVAVANPTTMVLATPYTWSEAHSTFGRKVTFEYTMVAGNYTGAREDSGGTFYEGEANCLSKKVIYTNIDAFLLDTVWTQRCGVYVPRSADHGVKVYYYNAGSTAQFPGQPGSATQAPRAPEVNTVAIAENVVGANPGVSPMQFGVAAGLGAGLGGMIQDAQQKALLNNAQFLFYQPEQPALRSAFGIR